jgi:uncharacterized protein
LDLLAINIDDIPEGGMSIAINHPDGLRKSGTGKEGVEGKIDLSPLEVHTVIGGGPWQDELLNAFDDPYLSFNKGFSSWITLFIANGSVIVRGRIVTAVNISCSRCAELFDHPIDIDFKSVLTRDEVSEKEIELTPKELEYTFFSGEKIDLGEIVTEQIALNLPVKPLCMDNCLGLCVLCGKNRNVEKCDCKEDKIDIRFEKLRHLIIE